MYFEIPLEDCPTPWVSALARRKRAASAGGRGQRGLGISTSVPRITKDTAFLGISPEGRQLSHYHDVVSPTTLTPN